MIGLSLERIGRGIKYLIILNVFQIAATIVFYHIASSVLTKAEIGLIATLTFLYTTITVISSLALPIAGAKYVSEFIGRGEEKRASAAARSVVRLVLMSSSIITAAFYTASIFALSNVSDYGEIVIPFSLICAASFLASLKLTHLGLVQGLHLFDRYAVANISTTITSYIVGVLLLPKLRLTGFAAGVLTGETIGLTLVMFFYQGQLPKTTSLNDYKALLKFSIPLLVMQVVTIFSDWADRILFFAVSLNLASLGIYDLAVRSAVSILAVGGFVEAIALPALSRAYGQAGKNDVTLLLRKALRYLGFMYFPVAFSLAAVSRTVMVSLYGEAYAEGGASLAMLSMSSAFMAFSGLLGSALKSIEKTRAFIRISLASLLVDVIVVASLTPSLGIIGAALARASSSFLAFTLFFHELRRWMKIEVDLDGLWKGLVGSTIPAASMFFFDMMHLSSEPINILIGAISGVISYIFALILLRALRKEDFQVFKQVMPGLTSLIDFVEDSASRFIR